MSVERDPIKRVLREAGIPASILKKTNEASVAVEEYYYDNGHCPVGRDTHYWVHDGVSSSYVEEETQPRRGYFYGAGYCRYQITGASFAFRVNRGKRNGFSVTPHVGQIMVWPTCDPAALAAAIEKEISIPEGY